MLLTFRAVLEALMSSPPCLRKLPASAGKKIWSCLSPQALLLQMLRSLRCPESEVNLCCPRSLLRGGAALSLAVCLVKSQHHGGVSPLSNKACPALRKSGVSLKKRKKSSRWRHADTNPFSEQRQWSGPAGAEWAERGGSWRSEQSGVKKKRNRSKFGENEETKTSKSSKTLNEFCLLFLGNSSEIPSWSDLFMNGEAVGELRPSLLATAIWTASNPSMKQQTQWKPGERVREKTSSGRTHSALEADIEASVSQKLKK